MKKTLFLIAAAAALMFCGSAMAGGGHGEDKGGGIDASHFVGDNHDKSFEDRGHEGDDHKGGDYGHGHDGGYGGGYDHHPSPPPVCDPPPVSTVPENPIWALMLLALGGAVVRKSIKAALRTNTGAMRLA